MQYFDAYGNPTSNIPANSDPKGQILAWQGGGRGPQDSLMSAGKNTAEM